MISNLLNRPAKQEGNAKTNPDRLNNISLLVGRNLANIKENINNIEFAVLQIENYLDKLHDLKEKFVLTKNQKVVNSIELLIDNINQLTSADIVSVQHQIDQAENAFGKFEHYYKNNYLQTTARMAKKGY